MTDNYWRDALVAALEDAGADGVLSDAQIEQAASVLAGAAETRGEITGEVEAGRGIGDGRVEHKRRLDDAISAAHARASRRRDQVGYPGQDPEYLAYMDRAHTLEEARTLAGLDRP